MFMYVHCLFLYVTTVTIEDRVEELYEQAGAKKHWSDYTRPEHLCAYTYIVHILVYHN